MLFHQNIDPKEKKQIKMTQCFGDIVTLNVAERELLPML